MDPKAKVIGILSGVLTAGIAFGIYVKSSNDPDAPKPAIVIDAGNDSMVTDLDSPPVPTGKVVVSGVYLPDGFSYTVNSLVLTGDAVGNFKIIDARQDGARLSVLAENISDGEHRFTATFAYARSK